MVAAIIISFDTKSSCLAEITGQLREIIDENIRFGRNKLLSTAQSVGYSTSEYSGAFARFHIRVTVSDHERARRWHLKMLQHVVQQPEIGPLLRSAIAAQYRIELLFDTQPAQHSDRQTMHLVADDNPLFAVKIIESFAHVWIKNRCVEHVDFITLEEYAHHFQKIFGSLLRKGMIEQVFHDASDARTNRRIRQRRKIEVGSRVVDGVGQIASGIR